MLFSEAKYGSLMLVDWVGHVWSVLVLVVSHSHMQK